MQKRCVLGRGRICLPLNVVPQTVSGKVRTYCCGQPELVCVGRPEDAACGKCRYILRQHLVADIPVEIGAAAYAGEPFLQCDPNYGEWSLEEE